MDQTTIDTYNKRAKEYDEQTSDFWDKFPRTFFDAFIGLSGEKILDVGSGPGRDGVLLKHAGKEVTCVDASEAMVTLSSERGLHSIVGDFMHMPFAESSFDGVWSYTALLHVSKNSIGQAMKEIHRIMKSDAIFGLGMIEGDTEEYRESSSVDMPRLFSFYTKQELESLLKEYGFEILYFESFTPRTRNYLHCIAKKRTL